MTSLDDLASWARWSIGLSSGDPVVVDGEAGTVAATMASGIYANLPGWDRPLYVPWHKVDRPEQAAGDA